MQPSASERISPHASARFRPSCEIGQYTTQCGDAQTEETCQHKWVSNASDPHKGSLCKWDGTSCNTTNECNVPLELIRHAARIYFEKNGAVDPVAKRLRLATERATDEALGDDHPARKDYASALSAFLHRDRGGANAFLNKLP